jgi:hypothetical protein
MTAFTTDELTAMRSAQQAHMMDTYVPQVYSRAFDAFGQEVVTFTDGTASACGLDMRPGSERHTPGNTLTEYDATIRVAVGSTLTTKDRVKVTKRFGETLSTPLVFEIVAPLQLGPSGCRFALKRVET